MDRYHLVSLPVSLSSGRLKSDRSAELSRVTGSNLDPKALVCANKKLLWNQTEKILRVARPGTHVSRFSSLVYKKAKICDMLLSVHCVYDTSLQFTLTPDTHAYSDLKFCPTWLNNIQHYNIQQNTWTFWILVPFPEISSQFFICMFYHP